MSDCITYIKGTWNFSRVHLKKTRQNSCKYLNGDEIVLWIGLCCFYVTCWYIGHLLSASEFREIPEIYCMTHYESKNISLTHPSLIFIYVTWIDTCYEKFNMLQNNNRVVSLGQSCIIYFVGTGCRSATNVDIGPRSVLTMAMSPKRSIQSWPVTKVDQLKITYITKYHSELVFKILNKREAFCWTVKRNIGEVPNWHRVQEIK